MQIHDSRHADGHQSLLNIDATRFFYLALFVTLVIRLGLAAWVPIIGDEAYFLVWGKHPSYGFYDHPPMVGWLLAGLVAVTDATWWLRLPSVLIPALLSWFIFRILSARNLPAAPWVALSFLVAPPNIINILVTTDTLLILFSFISAWYFYRAVEQTQAARHFILSGLFLGLAFFSKYFAVLLGITYGLYIIAFKRDKKSWLGLGLLLLMVMPFAGINILWNYNHCWNNILFNLLNRTSPSGYGEVGRGLLHYVVQFVYLFSPPLIYYLIRKRKQLAALWQDRFQRVYFWLAGLPLLLFLLLLLTILRKPIGLHWLLSFYPFAFLSLAALLDIKQWRVVFYFMLGFSIIHLIAISLILLLPAKNFAWEYEAQQDLVFSKYPNEVLAKLAPYEKDYVFGTMSYSMSAVAAYYSRQYYIVLGKGSHHSREDDRLTDFASLDGKNILLFKRTKANIDALKPYFKSTVHKTITVRDTTFEIVLGKGFDYPKYHREVLADINKTYYAIPSWLPTGQCEFKSRYGFP